MNHTCFCVYVCVHDCACMYVCIYNCTYLEPGALGNVCYSFEFHRLPKSHRCIVTCKYKIEVGTLCMYVMYVCMYESHRATDASLLANTRLK